MSAFEEYSRPDKIRENMVEMYIKNSSSKEIEEKKIRWNLSKNETQISKYM